MSIHIAIERTDGKRQLLPLKGNSALKFNATGDAQLTTDVSASSPSGVDFTESWAVTAISTGAGGTFTVAGNVSSRLTVGTRFTIDGSSNNDKVWNIAGVTYDSVGNTTTLTVASGETVGAVADGTILPYDLILRPEVSVSVALNHIQGVLTAMDTVSVTPIFTLERRSPTEQILVNAVSLGNQINPVSLGLRVASTSLANHLVSNDYPMYLRRIRAATATECKGAILTDGQTLAS